MVDDLHRFIQGQGAGSPGSGDLADAVTGHCGRDDAALPQHAGNADLNGKQGRLGNFGKLVAVNAAFPKQFVGNRPIGMAAEEPVNLADGFPEERFIQQGPAHAKPLGTIAGVDERRTDRRLHAGSAFQTVGFVIGKGLQRIGQLGVAAAVDHSPLLVPVTAEEGVIANVIQRGGRIGPQVQGKIAGGRLEGLGVHGGDQNRQRRDQMGQRGVFRSGFDPLDHHMGIGTAKAEGVDPHDQLALPFEEAVFHDHLQVELLEGDGRIQGGNTGRQRDTAVLDAEQRLDQTGHSGGRFKVADVAFDRTDRQRLRTGTQPPQCLSQGPGFDGVAHGGPGAMGLNIIDLFRIYPGLGVGLFQQVGLGVRAGHGQARFAAIGVHNRGGHHRQNPVTVANSGIVLLQQKQAAPFGTDITVAGGVEDIAQAAAGEHGGLGKGDETEGVQVQADPPGDGRVGFAGTDRAAGLVEGHQGGGTGRVDGHAGATQVKEVGEPVGGDTGGIAGGGGGIDGRQVVGQAVGIIHGGDADVDAAFAPPQGRGADAGILAGLPGQLQQHTLLGVHQGRLAGRDAEEGGIEQGDIPDGTGLEGIAGTGVMLVGMEETVLGPTLRINFGYKIAAVQQVLPEMGLVRAGKPEGVTDDGNFFAHGIPVKMK